MLRLALKMLFGDRSKYMMLICGLTFCSLLMTQQIGVFCGLMRWTTATLRNIQVPVVGLRQQGGAGKRDRRPARHRGEPVRRVEGVGWAVPLYWGMLQTRLGDGSFCKWPP